MIERTDPELNRTHQKGYHEALTGQGARREGMPWALLESSGKKSIGILDYFVPVTF